MKKGFTFIEVIVVITILGILVLLALGNFVGEAEKAKIGHIKNDSRAYEDAIEVAKMEDMELDDFWYEVEYSEIERLQSEGNLYDKRGKVKDKSTLLVERYKIIPKDKEILNTKLKGDFYLDSKGQVYYQPDNLKGDRIGNDSSDFYYFYADNPNNGEKYVSITGYKGKSQNVVIPEEIDGLPVRDIFYEAFVTMNTNGESAPESQGPNKGGNYTGNYSGVQIRNIHVSSNVRSIKTSAFKGLDLNELSIEEGLETIMNHIINNTTIKKELIFPDSMKNSSGFVIVNSNIQGGLDLGGLTSLKEFTLFESKINGTITIPETVEEFEDHAIAKNTINKIEFKEGLKKVGRFGFYENVSGDGTGFELLLPNSLEKIDKWGFSNNEISKLKLGNSIETIGEFAFAPSISTYEEVVIPESVKEIGRFAFSSGGDIGPTGEQYVSTIKRVILNGGEKIGNYAFANKYLEHVEIGEKVRVVDEFAFDNESMKEVYIPPTVEYVKSSAFDAEKMTVGARRLDGFFVPMTLLKELIILNSVEELVRFNAVPYTTEKITFEAPFFGLENMPADGPFAHLFSRDAVDSNGNSVNPLYIYGPSEMTKGVQDVINKNNFNAIWVEN